MLPTLQGSLVEESLPPIVRAGGGANRIVAFLSGCIAAQFYPETNRSTVAVLAANGCDVLTPPDQRCCGALANHSGDRETALALARHNVDVFDKTSAEYIVVNAAGLMLKEYGVLLADDPAYAERAHAFSARVRDITSCWRSYPQASYPHGPAEGDLPGRLPFGPRPEGAEAAPGASQAIPGLEMAEMYHSDWCCGSAGTYNVTQPELSEQVLARKMENVEATGADTVIASNPGCLIQLEKGIRDRGLKIRVAHPMDLLAQGYGLKL